MIKINNLLTSLAALMPIWGWAGALDQAEDRYASSLYAEAIPYYREAMPLQDEALEHYADALMRSGDSAAAIALLAPIMTKTPQEMYLLGSAYSKRGHGKSETTDSLYDNSTLVSDLKLLLDSLNIEKANLLGWSMAGNEITEFGIKYPERTNSLIFLEGGYDLSDESFKTIHQTVHRFLQPDSIALQSIDTYREWYHNLWFGDIEWNPVLEANLNASALINPDGSVTTIPDDYVSKLLLESAMSYHREYEKIQYK